MTVPEYEDRIGRVSVCAMRIGGEPLLDRVTERMGVAMRHLERIRTGQLELVPAVVDDIERSVLYAEELIETST